MNTNNKVQIKDKSLELALVKAAGELGTTQDKIKYKIVAEKKGFLGLFGKEICIEAWRKDFRAKFSKNKSQTKKFSTKKKYNKSQRNYPRKNITTSVVSLDSDKIISLVNTCEQLCLLMSSDSNTKVSYKTTKEVIHLDVTSEALAEQYESNHKLIDSMEHILKKILLKNEETAGTKVHLDINGLRKEYENNLIDMAQDLSKKVQKNKRPIVLSHKSSYDRKIIHMALDDDENVYTKSIGVAGKRKLMILPQKDRELN